MERRRRDRRRSIIINMNDLDILRALIYNDETYKTVRLLEREISLSSNQITERLHFTRKIFYMTLERLLDKHLIKRVSGMYSLTDLALELLKWLDNCIEQVLQDNSRLEIEAKEILKASKLAKEDKAIILNSLKIGGLEIPEQQQ
jgi:predicted transcriptional regulator